MRFIIHGAGAVGSLVGGKLAESGCEVVLIARSAHAEAVNRRGLKIKSSTGERVVKNLRAVTSPHEIKPRPDDVILLAVKSAETAHSVHALREVFAEATPFFCLQNGVRNEEMAAERFLNVYGAMAALCVTFISPGVVAHTFGNTISLGNYPLGCEEPCPQIAERLARAGFHATIHDSIMAIKWSKLILNLNNATYAILGRHLQLGLATPAICSFMADVEEEGLHTLGVAGISLEDPGNPINFHQRLIDLRSVVADAEKIYNAEQIPVELRTYPSTWMDLKQKRGDTEAGYFNGEIILLGEKHGVPTPYNAALLNIVEAMAAEGADPGRYTLEELADQVEQERLKIYHS